MPLIEITPDTPGFRYEDLADEMKNLPGLAQENWARIISSDRHERLDRIERTQIEILERLDGLNSRQVVKDYYSTEEVASRVGQPIRSENGAGRAASGPRSGP